MSNYRIAIFVFWFGPLPVYFPAWIASVKKNIDIDFFFFTDQEIEELPPNIHYYKTTLQDEVKRFSDGTGEKVIVDYGYKFCDLRPFIPQAYRHYLEEYDFWGYCDVDLVFGKIRDFLTDDILDRYERFYEWGHFCVLKNNEKMNRIYYLPGSAYSLEETLQSPVLLNADEQLGLNRICLKNSIAWYRNAEYVDFNRSYSDLLAFHINNYEYQVFCWDDGKAYRAFVGPDGQVGTEDFVYIHWQKRRPEYKNGETLPKAFYITSDEFVEKEIGVPRKEEIIRISSPKSEKIRRKERSKYLFQKICDFLNAPFERKRIWMRQKLYWILEEGHLTQQ